MKTTKNDKKTTEPVQESPEKPPSRRGRHDLRHDPVIVKRIVDAVMAGNPLRNAARLGGVSESCLFKWLAQGEFIIKRRHRADNYKVQFLQQIKDAEAKAVHRNIMCIQKAAQKTWQAAAWFLARRCPEFIDQQRVQQVGPGGGPVQVEDVTPVPQLTNERLRKLIALAEGTESTEGTTHGNGNGNGGSAVESKPDVASRA